jgi:hypothetical protein
MYVHLYKTTMVGSCLASFSIETSSLTYTLGAAFHVQSNELLMKSDSFIKRIIQKVYVIAGTQLRRTHERVKMSLEISKTLCAIYNTSHVMVSECKKTTSCTKRLTESQKDK